MSLLLLLLLLCGDFEVDPVLLMILSSVCCLSTEKSGLALQCEQCSCWLHNECVNVPAHVVDNFPFICPLCIKSSLSFLSEVRNLSRSEISLVNTSFSLKICKMAVSVRYSHLSYRLCIIHLITSLSKESRLGVCVILYNV